MSNTISLTQTLDDRQYVEALQRQYQLMEKMEKRLDGVAKAAKKAGDEAKKGADGAGQAISNVVEKIGSWATGLLSVETGFQLVRDATREARDESERLGREYDALIRKVATLGNLSALQTKKAQEQIMATAEEVGWTKEQATSAAVALMGAGFSTDQAIGPAAVALGKVMAASGEGDADPGEIATATANYNKAIGKPMNAESILEMGKRAVGLDSTNFTLKNIPDVAKIASGLNRINPEEQFAIQAALQDVYPTGAEASTAFKAFYSSLTTKGNRKEWQEAVGRLGLKADDIDFLGEDAATVLDRINTAYGAAPDKTRDNEMNSIFGEFAPGVVNLMQNAQKVRDNIALQKDTTAFDNKVKIATSGRNAGQRRLQIQQDRVALQGDQQGDLVGMARTTMEREQNDSISGKFDAYVGSKVYDLMTGMGFSPETAHRYSGSDSRAKNYVSWDRVKGRVEQATGEPLPGSGGSNGSDPQMAEQTAILRSIDSKLGNGGAPSSPVMQQGRKQ